MRMLALDGPNCANHSIMNKPSSSMANVETMVGRARIRNIVDASELGGNARSDHGDTQCGCSMLCSPCFSVWQSLDKLPPAIKGFCAKVYAYARVTDEVEIGHRDCRYFLLPPSVYSFPQAVIVAVIRLLLDGTAFL